MAVRVDENVARFQIAMNDALLVPVMDGVETFHALRERAPALPILLMSGYNADDRVEALIAAGAAGYLAKPFIADDPFEPYTIAAVELAEEKMVILGQMASGVKHSDLKAGMQVELVVERIYEIDDVEHTVWKWRPLAA